VKLQPEPEMGLLEVVTFPPGARVTIGAETRHAPARWRLPAGPVEARVELEGFAPRLLHLQLPPTAGNRAHRIQARLEYAEEDREEVVGRLVVYPAAPQAPPADELAAGRIRSFFGDDQGEEGTLEEGFLIGASHPGPAAVRRPAQPEGEPLGECLVRRGILIIGRDDPRADVRPDVRLSDPGNSVSRGCHAWLWVYEDRSTGAAFNTFLVGNNSPAGIRVDGIPVMETRRLSDDSVVEVGGFRLRLVKRVPRARVEFG
jgi:hypothetical protein